MKRIECYTWCVICGDRIKTTPYRLAYGKARTCGRLCAGKYRSIKFNLLQSYRQTGDCLWCGSPVMSPKVGRPRVDYCCQHHRSKHQWSIIRASGWTKRGKAA